MNWGWLRNLISCDVGKKTGRAILTVGEILNEKSTDT